jgi:multidrug efflux pump subunit AcrB
MWIVRLALRQPYTFTVVAVVLFIGGVASFLAMPQDIFPRIDPPIVTVIWTYHGLPPQEMERRFVTVSERAMNTAVGDIAHEESQSYTGVAVLKLFFQPQVKVEQAVTQVAAVSQTLLHLLPPGASPPLVLPYRASSVPVLQLAVGSASLSGSDLFDQSLNFIRPPLTRVKGVLVPLPCGGEQRLVSVDLDLRKCQALDISPMEVSNAINDQNVILPSGTVKIGEREYNVLLNSSPDLLDELNNLPVKQADGATIFIHDVAQVRDGYAPQTNVVKLNGNPAVLLSVLKSGSASTVEVVDAIEAKLPLLRAQISSDLTLTPLLDQAHFVKAALRGLLVEGGVAAALAVLLAYLFLGSWRSTLVVVSWIPLALCVALVLLAALGQTINLMTLGGLVLAAGILVDDAIVTMENIQRHLSFGQRPVKAILEAAHQTARPALVSTLAVGLLFLPIFFLGGVTASLFAPLALAVIFAVLGSHLISRTVAPTFAHLLLPAETEDTARETGGFFSATHRRFLRGFAWLQEHYAALLRRALAAPRLVIVVATAFALLDLVIFTPFLGRDFFPAVDTGQFRLHVRAPSGTRIEQTELGFSQVEKIIRQVIPPSELDLVLDDIGLPVGGTNLAYSDSATIGPGDGEMLVALKPGHRSTPGYVREIRDRLRYLMPDYVFFTQPADVVDQTLDSGRPSPIDVQVAGPSRNDKADYDLAGRLLEQLRSVRGAVDVHLRQVASSPTLFVDVDRTRASEMGLTQRDIASDLLVSLSSSGQVSPNYWFNPVTGVNYSVAVQTPQYKLDSLDALKQTPISAGKLAEPQLLGNLAPITRADSPALISHYDDAPVYDIDLNVQGRDLGGVADDVAKVIGRYAVGATDPARAIPAGSEIRLRGQVESMDRVYAGLGVGLLAALALVYFLLVVNFQSWLDPIIVLAGLPGALAGIVWMLFLTDTPLSVPALLGAALCLGVATANSVLVVDFANDERRKGRSAPDAALAACRARLRPVLMTALVVMLGLLPMALGLGGGEENAPLGRAVIGGLFVATFFTLLVVPALFSVLRAADRFSEIDPLLVEPGRYEVTDDVEVAAPILRPRKKAPAPAPNEYDPLRYAPPENGP